MTKRFIIVLSFLTALVQMNLFAQEWPEAKKHPKVTNEAEFRELYGRNFPPTLYKVNGSNKHTKQSIINGNKITTIVYNYGSICRPGTLGNIADLVWQGLGYGYEFGPLAAAEIYQGSDTLQITSDSFVSFTEGDYSPDRTIKWGWLPNPEFVDTSEGQNEIARLNIGDKDGDGKPDSWPYRWYNPDAGAYLWPAFLGDQATSPDEEVYYVVDDFSNAEFPYYPFPSDSGKRGLGLNMDVRYFQFSNPLAEDIMFLVYQITNVSPKELNPIYFGMHGDPHVGGPNNWADDKAGFIDPFGNSLDVKNVDQRSRNMVYSWDDDMTGDGGRPAGYFGWKFLESPTNSIDGEDNDDDGITDDSPYNSAGRYLDDITNPIMAPYITDEAKYTSVYGVPRARWEGDEDGDWLPEFDDIGIDGIGPNSKNYPGPDFGEADGRPSQAWFVDGNGNGKLDPAEVPSLQEDYFPGSYWGGSEPNFGFRDISESDQLGLTSFHAAGFGGSNFPINDPLMWEWLSSDSLAIDQRFLKDGGDNIFNFSTGPLGLKTGESQRFSMAILFGNNLDQLILSAESSSRVLESDYRFAKPPEKPKVRVVPGDGIVTIYWDRASENSFDPFVREFDFQGYKIYRSRDYTFRDVKTITDGFGNSFIGKGIAQFDIDDSLKGFHPIDFAGRGIKYNLGSNTGLAHEYVDSSVTNGITYYYAVAAYDGGSIPFDLPPTETQTSISKDPITGELSFDVNTAVVTPMSIAPGVIDAGAGIDGFAVPVAGNSTGPVVVKVLEDQEVKEKIYEVKFIDDEYFNVLDSTGVVEEFTSKGPIFVDLSSQNIIGSTLVVKDKGGNVIDASKYDIKLEAGKIKSSDETSLPAGEKFTVSYKYYPVFQSNIIDGSDGNDSFDGLRVYLTNENLDLDEVRSGWHIGNSNVQDSMLWSPSNSVYIGNPHVQYRADWEIRWLGVDTLADGSWSNIGDTASAFYKTITTVICPFNIYNVSEFDTEGNPLRAKYIVDESKSKKGGNGRWDWGEGIIVQPQNPKGSTVSYYLNFKKNKRIPEGSQRLPKAGDVYVLRTSKPYQKGDKYVFETKPSEIKKEGLKDKLNDIYVVPNPYVAYSLSEEPGRTAEKRGERQLQFRNLPPECTIRIFTLTGELVQKIEKDDVSSTAYWDLLSSEGLRVAYGVYIYHVDVPGVGEKIGRIALIK